jgi:uncharacterized protein (TIGR00251 family)
MGRASLEVKVRLHPRARHNEIAGEREGALVVRVSAPPVDGKANAALCKLIARALGIGRGRVTIVRGASAREKVVRIDGVTEDRLRSTLQLSGGPVTKRDV